MADRLRLVGLRVLFAAVCFVGLGKLSATASEPAPACFIADDSPRPIATWFDAPMPLEAEPAQRTSCCEVDPACQTAVAPCEQNYCQCQESWFDNLSFFGGLDGSKQPQDLGVNAHFGGRLAVNAGVPLLRELGLGMQLGTSVNWSDNAVDVFERTQGNEDRWQSFSTIGLFQRTDFGLRWGAVYDVLAQDYYDDFLLGQWRGLAGVALTCSDELGVWGAFSSFGDSGFFGTTPVSLDAITMVNAYWRHTWQSGAQTMLWGGVAEGHAQSNIVLGDGPNDGARVVFGSSVFVPLNDWFAIFGEANFITPADTGTVDAYLGMAFYPGGGAWGAGGRRFSPLLPLANNPTFALDVTR